jgi:hypothetical protein
MQRHGMVSRPLVGVTRSPAPPAQVLEGIGLGVGEGAHEPHPQTMPCWL